jgi:tetratricopeptide (TPR) repeat protein
MYQAALDGYRARGEPAVISFGLIGLANHCIRQRRTDEARQLATEAVEWARRAGDERMRGTALGSLGMIAKQKGEYADALGIFGEVERLFARLGNDEAVAAAAGNRGEVLAALGRLDEAEQLQLSVLEVNRRLERRDNEGANYLDLGTLNRQRGNLDAAKHWFDAAVEVFRSIGDPSNEAFALYRLASIASDQQQFEKAIELASSALPLVEKRNPGFAADLWEQVGRANLSLGWISRAERAYRNCIGLAEPLDRDALLASSWQNLGLTLLLQQRNDEASAAFTRALELWGLHADPQQLEYCRLCDAAVRLDSRIAALSDAGHATPDPAEARAAAREMLTLYPDLVAMYRSIGAMQLVAAFSASAASTARFVGDVGAACDWHREAADVYEAIGLTAQATDQRSRREALIR